MCPTCFPQSSLPADASLSSTGSSGASSPASTVLSKRYDFLLPISPHFVSFAWRYLGFHSLFSLPDGRVHRQGLELVTRSLPPGIRRGGDRTSQVPGEPQSPVCRVPNRRRQDGWHQTLKCRRVAPGHRKAEAPTKGLSTLDSTAFGLAVYASQGRLPDTTQDSLPVAGQALRDGVLTRKVPMKGFQVVIYISSPVPRLRLAQSMQPPQGRSRLNCGRWAAPLNLVTIPCRQQSGEL